MPLETDLLKMFKTETLTGIKIQVVISKEKNDFNINNNRFLFFLIFLFTLNSIYKIIYDLYKMIS